VFPLSNSGLGGVIWSTGAVASFLASKAELVGLAVSFAIGQRATMVSAFWGVFVLARVFVRAGRLAQVDPLDVFFFLTGLGAIAVAPLIIR
jgi:glucose uptake protein